MQQDHAPPIDLRARPAMVRKHRDRGKAVESEADRRWARQRIGYVMQGSVPGKLPISVEDAVLLGRWGRRSRISLDQASKTGQQPRECWNSSESKT